MRGCSETYTEGQEDHGEQRVTLSQKLRTEEGGTELPPDKEPTKARQVPNPGQREKGGAQPCRAHNTPRKPERKRGGTRPDIKVQ